MPERAPLRGNERSRRFRTSPAPTRWASTHRRPGSLPGLRHGDHDAATMATNQPPGAPTAARYMLILNVANMLIVRVRGHSQGPTPKRVDPARQRPRRSTPPSRTHPLPSTPPGRDGIHPARFRTTCQPTWGLLGPCAVTSRMHGPEGAPAQQCAGATRPRPTPNKTQQKISGRLTSDDATNNRLSIRGTSPPPPSTASTP